MNAVIRSRLEALERKRRLQLLALRLAESARAEKREIEGILRRICATARAIDLLRRLLNVSGPVSVSGKAAV